MPATNWPVSDTAERLRVTHWLWTSESPNGKLTGRDGIKHPWYGVGQSLIMLPADMLVTTVIRELTGSCCETEKKRLLQFVGVSYLVFPLINSLVILLGFKILQLLGFNKALAISGALSLLFATSFLWHSQNNQENPLQLLVTLTGAFFTLSWMKSNRSKHLLFAVTTLGFNLLIRLTSLADLAGILAIPLLVYGLDPASGRAQFLSRLKIYCQKLLVYGLPVILAFLALDRVYHWWRFGSFHGTYIGLFGKLSRELDPALPVSFPFNHDFLKGFIGPFLFPGKSVFLYDPLLVVTLVVAAILWKRLVIEVKAFVIASILILIVTAAGYAKYYNWSGESSWGNRFTTVPVHMLTLLALPFLMEFGFRLKKHIQKRIWLSASILTISASLFIQFASLVYPPWLETMQTGVASGTDGKGNAYQHQGEECYLCLRIVNLAADVSGNFQQWGLDKTRDGKSIGLRTPLLVPFLTFRTFPHWFAALINLIWFVLALITLFLLIVTFRRIMQESQSSTPKVDFQSSVVVSLVVLGDR